MSKLASLETQSQIMAAFSKIISDRQNIVSKVATKEEQAEREKRKQVLEQAATYTVDSLVKGLADLQLDFSGVITELSEKLETESAKLDAIKRGISIQSQQLEELQKIRMVADVLHLVTQEHQEKMNRLETQASQRQESLEKEIARERKLWEKEQEDFETAAAEYQENTAKHRQQEAEDYSYNLQRQRQIETDQYEEAKRRLERQIEETTKEHEKNWREREKVLNAEQAKFESDRQRVATFKEELKQALNKAKEEAIQEATREAKVKADLLAKEWESNQQGYELQVASLEATIERQNEQITNLSAQLQETMKQAQDLAMRAFSGNRNNQ
ncbi:MAG: hypothetical protein P5702_12710 [Limnospira sp. PMC 1291.21]|uniref:hypothetical protein n=1 Tax=Limnospira TaxID=2596745 RepID=UPI000280411F|nr:MULTISPECIES: hypothetical protein [Limnospira]EKD10013.1 hypothetical protein SPLC1_S100430 [Arthrospira platensis C1]MDY7054274.1 hypothetical protein [Limnospira fusiformis LS22]QJB28458.1 hypothetical protein HFV01_24985 [Limnospira fusiformis SAG 85.79]MDT9178307.1 hypothetical protein [Limnospira sp. PMC 1238.20]MDT9195212.1 hypothetical protein [Limnospira sp. PMC 1245.20]